MAALSAHTAARRSSAGRSAPPPTDLGAGRRGTVASEAGLDAPRTLTASLRSWLGPTAVSARAASAVALARGGEEVVLMGSKGVDLRGLGT